MRHGLEQHVGQPLAATCGEHHDRGLLIERRERLPPDEAGEAHLRPECGRTRLETLEVLQSTSDFLAVEHNVPKRLAVLAPQFAQQLAATANLLERTRIILDGIGGSTQVTGDVLHVTDRTLETIDVLGECPTMAERG